MTDECLSSYGYITLCKDYKRLSFIVVTVGRVCRSRRWSWVKSWRRRRARCVWAWRPCRGMNSRPPMMMSWLRATTSTDCRHCQPPETSEYAPTIQSWSSSPVERQDRRKPSCCRIATFTPSSSSHGQLAITDWLTEWLIRFLTILLIGYSLFTSKCA